MLISLVTKLNPSYRHHLLTLIIQHRRLDLSFIARKELLKKLLSDAIVSLNLSREVSVLDEFLKGKKTVLYTSERRRKNL